MAFGSTAGFFMFPVIEGWATGQPGCFSKACLVADLSQAVKAGIAAVLGLYVPSSFYRKPPTPISKD